MDSYTVSEYGGGSRRRRRSRNQQMSSYIDPPSRYYESDRAFYHETEIKRYLKTELPYDRYDAIQMMNDARKSQQSLVQSLEDRLHNAIVLQQCSLAQSLEDRLKNADKFENAITKKVLNSIDGVTRYKSSKTVHNFYKVGSNATIKQEFHANQGHGAPPTVNNYFVLEGGVTFEQKYNWHKM